MKITSHYRVFWIIQQHRLSKVLEKIVLSRLLNFLEAACQHEPHKSTYRSAYSTETALVRVSSGILFALDRREGVVLVLLDLSAAFDTIDSELMLNRLSNIGVEGTALKWLSSYLQDRHQSVSISGSTSKSMPLRFGVPQGSVLGPFLFTQYTVAIGKFVDVTELDINSTLMITKFILLLKWIVSSISKLH